MQHEICLRQISLVYLFGIPHYVICHYHLASSVHQPLVGPSATGKQRDRSCHKLTIRPTPILWATLPYPYTTVKPRMGHSEGIGVPSTASGTPTRDGRRQAPVGQSDIYGIGKAPDGGHCQHRQSVSRSVRRRLGRYLVYSGCRESKNQVDPVCRGSVQPRRLALETCNDATTLTGCKFISSPEQAKTPTPSTRRRREPAPKTSGTATPPQKTGESPAAAEVFRQRHSPPDEGTDRTDKRSGRQHPSCRSRHHPHKVVNERRRPGPAQAEIDNRP